MNDLEQFLRQASRGLWGRERQTVRRELESHVRQRSNRYEISGSSEVEAIKLAIADLGEPRAISSGMKGVYSVPTTIRAGVLTAALATFVFMGVQISTAQVTGTNVFPTPACLEQQKATFKVGPNEIPCQNGFDINVERVIGARYMQAWPLTLSGFAIDIKKLQKVLEPLGATFEKSSLKDSFRIRFPEGNTLTLSEWTNERFYDGNSEVFNIPIINGYVSIWEFWDQLRRFDLPIQVKGWNNPQITIGRTSFTLGSSATQVNGLDVYWALLSRELNSLFLGLNDNSDYDGNELLYTANTDSELIPGRVVQPGKRISHTLRTGLPTGSIAMVMSREWLALKNQKPKQFRRVFLAPVSKDGTITYTSFSKKLSVVRVSQIKRATVGGTGTIAVARFTGKLGLTISSLEAVDPATIKIASR
jgi:hypothetical protein